MNGQHYKGRELAGIKEACMLAGITRRTLYNWMDTRKVEFVRTAAGQRRIFVDTLFRPIEAPK